MHAEDIFWHKKSDRHRRNHLQRSVSKVSTPKSEVAFDEEPLRMPYSGLRKKSNCSLKQLFKGGRYRGSQKSLLSSGGRRSKLALNMESVDTDYGDRGVPVSFVCGFILCFI